MQNMTRSGVQFPGVASSIPDGFVRSISHPLSKVKSSLKDVTQTKQFKRWFGDSKIVNEYGTPKMRLRENAGGIGFFYGNKKRISDSVKGLGLQLPAIFRNIADSDTIIRDVGEIVNRQISDVTQTKQFKRWFGHSKIVNEDGAPKIVYHQTASCFYIVKGSASL